MAESERTLQALKVVLGVIQDDSNRRLGVALRQQRRELELWRAGACKPIVGRCYTINEQTQEYNGWQLGGDHAFLYEGTVQGHVNVFSVSNADKKKVLHYAKAHIKHVFNSGVEEDGKPIMFYIAPPDLHNICPLEDDDATEIHPSTRRPMPLRNDEPQIAITVLLHTGEQLQLQVNASTTADQIWNVVADKTPGLLFDLCLGDKPLSIECLAQSGALRQVLQ